jgi:hypothetical protein
MPKRNLPARHRYCSPQVLERRLLVIRIKMKNGMVIR